MFRHIHNCCSHLNSLILSLYNTASEMQTLPESLALLGFFPFFCSTVIQVHAKILQRLRITFFFLTVGWRRGLTDAVFLSTKFFFHFFPSAWIRGGNRVICNMNSFVCHAGLGGLHHFVCHRKLVILGQKLHYL